MVTFNGEEIGGSQTNYSTAQNKLNDAIERAKAKRRRRRARQYTPAPVSQNVEQPKLDQPQAPQSVPTPQPQAPPKQTTSEKWAAYNPQINAVVTSDNKVYPSLRRGGYNGWIPEGYKKGELKDVTTLYYIKDVDPVTGKVKGSWGSSIKERYLYGASNSLPDGSNNNEEDLNTSLPFLKNGLDSTSSGYNLNSNSSPDNLLAGKKGVDKITSQFSEFGRGKEQLWKRDYEGSKGLRKIGAGTGYYFARIGRNLIFDMPKNVYTLFTDPIGTGKSIGTKIIHPITTGKELYKSAKTDPLGFSADVTSVFVPLPVGKGTSFIKRNVAKIGAKEVKTTEVIGEVTSKSKGEIITKFVTAKKDNKFLGVHTTSTKFSKFGKEGKRIEDKGVFIAEWGAANKAWLGTGTETKWSFNPLKNIGRSPNIIKVEFESLKELPPQVVAKAKAIKSSSGRTAAYNYVNKWYNRNARPGTAYIPLRTELWETPETQAIIPFKYDVKLKREGNILQRIKGYREYVKVDGEIVPIRKFITARKGKGKYKGGGEKFSITKLDEKYNNYLSSSYKGTRYITPSYSRLLRYKSSKYSTTKYGSYKNTFGGSQSYGSYNPGKDTYTFNPRITTPKYSYKYPGKTQTNPYGSLIIPPTGKSPPNKKRRTFNWKNSRGVTKESKKRKYEFKTVYTPSFTASVFKIKGKKPKELIKGYSPFIRPLA